jgi:hypothetical protein
LDFSFGALREVQNREGGVAGWRETERGQCGEAGRIDVSPTPAPLEVS